MLSLHLAHALFGLAALVLFWRRTPAEAAWAVFLGGWLLLPVGRYPPSAFTEAFPFRLTGLALPSDLAWGKSWLVPLAALAGSLVCDLGRWRRLRPVPADALLAVWITAPLWTAPWHAPTEPPPWAASLETALTWGGPWLLGRLYAADAEGRRLLLRALRAAGLACLPIAVLEGATGPWLYDAVYGVHPFREDGAPRHVGFRPLGFFEHGNQYGLWLALCALAALSLAHDRRSRWAAAVLVAMTLAAQSTGALVLLALGAALLVWWPRPQRRWLIALPAAALVSVAVYASGVLPVHQWARETAWGARALAVMREAGGSSLAWRVSQDQRLARDALARSAVGHGRWNWFEAHGTRPWGLPLLLAGAWGLPALAAAFGALVLPSLAWAWRAAREGPLGQGASPAAALALLPLLASVDALLNSFLFFPALAAAGALAASTAGHTARR